MKRFATSAMTALLLAANVNATSAEVDVLSPTDGYSIELPQSFSSRSPIIGLDKASSPNGFDTNFTFENKGAYKAKVDIEFKFFSGNVPIQKIYPGKWIYAGEVVKIRLPHDVFDVKVTTSRQTGLAWSPVRTIVSKNLCVYNNKWTDYSNLVNEIKLDVWGTTIHPKWKFVQVKGTTDNGTDTSQDCADY